MSDDPLALVIVDDYDESLVFANALREAGYEPQIVRSGDTALTWLKGGTPAVVVLASHLPRVPGTEILDFLESEPRFEDTRVVVITRFSQTAREMEKRVGRVLLSPVNAGQLKDVVE